MVRRLLAPSVGIALLASSANAQVYKPRSATPPAKTTTPAKTPAKTTDKSSSTDKVTDDDSDTPDKPDKPDKKPAAAPKKPAPTATARHVQTKPVKSRAAKGKGRPSDLTPDGVDRSDPDFFEITDDDD
jgi:hypothetical protein